MKIIFIISSLKKCGPVSQLYELLSAQENNNNITILALSEDHESTRLDDFEDIGVDVITLDSSNFRFLSAPKNIRKELTKGHYDVICSQGFRSDLSCSLMDFSYRKKTFSIIHNYMYVDYRDQYSKLTGAIMTSVHAWSLRRLGRVISVSKAVEQNLQHVYEITSIAIQNGVSQKTLNTDKPQNKNSKLVGLYVGPVIKRKSVEELVRAFSQVDSIQFELQIAGDGEQYDILKEKYIGDPRIRFLGFQEDVSELYQSADFYVSASQAEGLPMSVLEALSYGLVCLLSDIEPHSEIKSELPSQVTIVDFSDEPKLIEIVNLMLGDTGKKERARRFNGSVLSSKKMALKYFETFSATGQFGDFLEQTNSE